MYMYMYNCITYYGIHFYTHTHTFSSSLPPSLPPSLPLSLPPCLPSSLIENKRKTDIIRLLKSRGYPSDPVKKWKQAVSDDRDEEGSGEEEEEGGGEGEDKLDYNYLLSLSMWSLSLEKKEELLKKRDEKVWREGGREGGWEGGGWSKDQALLSSL